MTTTVKILNEAQIRGLISMDEASLRMIEEAFVWVGEGKIEMPPIMHISVPEHEGDIDIKSAYVHGQDIVAVKVAAGFFKNHLIGLPSSSSMVVAVSAKTGRCEAILLDNAYLTDLRTGLAGAVAAKHLANDGPCNLGVIGTGVQARFQAEAVALVRDVKHIRVAGRNSHNIDRCVADLEASLNAPVEGSSFIEYTVANSDIIVTTTPSQTPLIKAEWLRPGQHVTAMGSDLPGKTEIHADAVLRADVLAADFPAQAFTHGELQPFGGQSGFAKPVASLGDIIRARAIGRTAQDQITLCDLSGIGVQDTAIAIHLLKQARSSTPGIEGQP